MFACRVCVVSNHKYPSIWVDTNSTCLLNESRFLNPNMTHLLNEAVMSTYLSNFIKMKKKNVYIYIYNIKFRTNE